MGATAPSVLEAYMLKNGTGGRYGYFYSNDCVNSKYLQIDKSGTINVIAGDYVSLWVNPTSQNVAVISAAAGTQASYLSISSQGGI